MKLYIYFFLLMIFVLPYRGNSQCLGNGDFLTSTCGDESDNNNCYYFTSTCLPNWHPSNGTPQRLGTTDPYLFMWSSYHYYNKGEGVYASYNFVKNTPYVFNIRVKANGGTGGFYVYAANGLVESPSLNECGSALQTAANKQFIEYGSPTLNADWVEYPVSFIPNANYTQLWIYPYDNTNTQYNLYVDWVSLCSSGCAKITPNATYFNYGVVGSYNAGSIYLGSSYGTGGSGTVTIDANTSTTFIANDIGDGIQLLPNFDATVSTGSFEAFIIPYCDPATLTTRINSNIFSKNNSLPQVDEKAGAKDSSVSNMQPKLASALTNEITIYPVPVTNGQLTITNKIYNFNNAPITITDASGKIVFAYYDKTNENRLSLNVSQLNNGVYFVKIKTTKGITTKKIIVNKQ